MDTHVPNVQRPDPAPAAATSEAGTCIVLFDGVCNLCTGSVQFVIRRDPQGLFRFASIQSPVGRRLYEEQGLSGDRLETILVLDGGRALTHSDAALAVASRLGWPWRAAAAFRIVPKAWRDAAYRWIARNRYRWFGRHEQCLVPTPDLRRRFLA